MRTFFDKQFLSKYMSAKIGQFFGSLDIESKITGFLESEQVEEIIDNKLSELSARPEGMWLSMMGIDPANLKPMIKPFIVGMGADIGPTLMTNIDPMSFINVEKIRQEVDNLMVTKLQELNAGRVKKLMEDVIRKHLGWLIVWGNVFGGILGLITKGVEVATGANF
eukprot:CAMPEP_0168521534 /NCGR_PEP_ID=MMETSP0405-20121227/8725_1 /TAXON_ID=498012 /ORGANISM="Trichosphaerium sp, Strain Am-I-7 wt" /LENGTH=165 /DNA_ID=CAMNT_0008542795 /DNA_START=317 /DNA_END=814 /DNA_ORIENTATION=-